MTSSKRQGSISRGSVTQARCSTSKPRSAYRRRLSELREELEEAKEPGNVERAERAEQEIDALTRELSRAVGLGGRDRRAGSASERARQSIGKSVKTVLERIAQNDAALGDVLTRCIRTGTFCSYQPDPISPIVWEFAATIAEQQVQPITGAETTPARADRSQALPPVLETSPFSLAERTAFVGREAERAAIRAVIDRALSGHGSVVMLGDGPGVGKTRLAMEMAEYASRVGFRCSVGHCYERDEPFPYPSVRRDSLKAISRRRRASMTTVGGWGTTRPNWPRLLQVFDEFFRIFRNRWNCRRRSSAAISFRAFQRRWRAARTRS